MSSTGMILLTFERGSAENKGLSMTSYTNEDVLTRWGEHKHGKELLTMS